MEQLPDDMLANVLGRLPPSSLAASRCVRKHWCSIIDARRLLLTDLLPLRVEAFFCNSYFIFNRTFLFARPTAARRIPGGHLDFFDDDDVSPIAMDHCNGLLLHYEMVVNPATRQWATWPPVPQHLDDLSPSYSRHCFALVYDPMVSPNHYEVFLITLPGSGYVYNHNDGSSSRIFEDDDFQQEWPPLSYTVYVFSSSTKEWRWEERSFVRRQGGEAVGTIADMHIDESSSKHKTVYFRRSLYVHCPNDSIMRLSLSDDKYQMIKPPPAAGSKTKTSCHCDASSYLGKSEKGVYYAILDLDGPQFQVWLLTEFSGQSQTEWVLKCNVSLQATLNFARHIDAEYGVDGPWILNYEEKEAQPTAQEEEFAEWDFDNAVTVLETETNDKTGSIDFLGFHPYKDISFLFISNRVISYHLNNSKVQDLGTINIPQMEDAFPYTPCWMGELSEKNKA
ncbi:uncharacterized protein [Miscanthus floridulus]|uniref:uncharacterized protein n=1 Tax=Miscanthus floridulus TaxID=154761 RepID=UPI003459B354